MAEIAHAKVAKDARNTGGKGRGGGAILDVEFLILDCRKVTLLRPADGTSKGWRTTTLLTRFAETFPTWTHKCGTSEDMSRGARGRRVRG